MVALMYLLSERANMSGVCSVAGSSLEGDRVSKGPEQRGVAREGVTTEGRGTVLGQQGFEGG